MEMGPTGMKYFKINKENWGCFVEIVLGYFPHLAVCNFC